MFIRLFHSARHATQNGGSCFNKADRLRVSGVVEYGRLSRIEGYNSEKTSDANFYNF